MKEYLALFVQPTQYDKDVVLNQKTYRAYKMEYAEKEAEQDVLNLGLTFTQLKKVEVRVFLVERKEFTNANHQGGNQPAPAIELLVNQKDIYPDGPEEEPTPRKKPKRNLGSGKKTIWDEEEEDEDDEIDTE